MVEGERQGYRRRNHVCLAVHTNGEYHQGEQTGLSQSDGEELHLHTKPLLTRFVFAGRFQE